MRAPIAFALLLASLSASRRAEEPPDAPPEAPSPEALVRAVVRNQRTAERKLDAYTFDQLEETTTYRSDGSMKEVRARLYYVMAGPGEGSRELAEVDGRPATEEEKREAAEEDRKSKRKIDEKAVKEASRERKVGCDDDDPLVGPRRLSDLLTRFDVRIVGKEERGGRAVWVVDFAPRAGVPTASLGDRALAALAGRAWIDAEDLQVQAVDSELVKPIKVAGGLFANLKEATIRYEAAAVVPGTWVPSRIALRVKGTKALVFPLNALHRFTLSNFRSFSVETESATSAPEPAGPDPR